MSSGIDSLGRQMVPLSIRTAEPSPIGFRQPTPEPPESRINTLTYEFSVVRDLNARPRKLYNVVGDHLTIAEIRGGNSELIVKLGSPMNPWLTVEAGDVIQRPFDRVELCSTGLIGAEQFASLSLRNVDFSAVVYASFGPVFVRPKPRHVGVRAGFPAKQATADVNGRLVYQDLVDDLSSDVLAVFGRNGAFVMVQNTDQVNTLLLAFETLGLPGPVENSWELEPGQVVHLYLDSIVQNRFDFGGTPLVEGMCVKTRAGTCQYQYLLSRFPTTQLAASLSEMSEPKGV